jgi:hypothetical protein
MRSSVFVSISTGEIAGDNQAFKWSRPRMGARDKNDRDASLNMMDGEVRMDEMVCGFGEGVDAKV